MKSLYISHVKLLNVLGIEELEFDAGRFVEISGKNGASKTSILDGIKAIIKGGSDASLVHKGASKGEGVLVLNDGTNIRRVFKDNGTASTLTITKNGTKVERPQSVLDGMVDMLSINPIEFLLAKPKDRLNVLLQAMPLKVDQADMEEKCGIQLAPELVNCHAFDAIHAMHKAVFDERTVTNRLVAEKESTIKQLRQTLPEEIQNAVSESLATLLDEQRALLESRDIFLDKVQKQLDSYNVGFAQRRTDDKAVYDEAVRVAREQYDSQIEVINAEADVKKTAAAEIKDKRLEVIAVKNNELTARITRLQEQEGQRSRSEATLENIRILDVDLTTLKEKAVFQDGVLQHLHDYKLELMSKLPITGLEIVNGDIFRDGIAFDRLNTAQKVQISVEIAKMRAGTLGIMCVDGIESLDLDTYGVFKEEALESGLQLFVSYVSENPLNITNCGD